MTQVSLLHKFNVFYISIYIKKKNINNISVKIFSLTGYLDVPDIWEVYSLYQQMYISLVQLTYIDLQSLWELVNLKSQRNT